LREYPLRKYSKLLNLDSKLSLHNSIVMLSHPSISISDIKYIGKEINLMDERIVGLIPSEMEYLVFEPDDWIAKWISVLRKIPTHEIVEGTGLSRTEVQ
jgi:hypothetical protein